MPDGPDGERAKRNRRTFHNHLIGTFTSAKGRILAAGRALKKILEQLTCKQGTVLNLSQVRHDGPYQNYRGKQENGDTSNLSHDAQLVCGFRPLRGSNRGSVFVKFT